MQILIVYGPPSINWPAVGRCPTLPALGKTCMHLVSCVKRLLCFTSKPYPGMHWLLCLCLFCYISILHKQEMRKVNPTRLLLFLPVAAQVKSAQVTQHKSAPRQLKSAPVSPQVSPKYIYIYTYTYIHIETCRDFNCLFRMPNSSTFSTFPTFNFSRFQHFQLVNI